MSRVTVPPAAESLVPNPEGGRAVVLAATVTPFTRDGAVDTNGCFELVRFLRAAGVDGVFALGTTGEGLMLSQSERQRVAETFLAAADAELAVVVHAGATSTDETVALADHAAQAGASGIAVVAPPFYRPDEGSLLSHFLAAAAACAPLPFYVYVYTDRSGYSVPVPLIERLADRAPNFAGAKISDRPYERLASYLNRTFDVLVGAEILLTRALQAGAVGAVSALAGVFPEIVLGLATRPGDPEAPLRLAALEETLGGLPMQAVLKSALRQRGVTVGPSVRRPLRGLTPTEQGELERRLEASGFVSPLKAAGSSRHVTPPTQRSPL